MKRNPLLSLTALALLMAGGALFAGPAAAQCPYTSVQSRVQPNVSTPWTQSLNVVLGQQFRVGAFKNGWGVFVDPGTATITVTAPNSSQSFPANGSYVTASQAGVYTVRVTCGSFSDTATVSSVGSAYDMLDYMRSDTPAKPNMLKQNGNGVQPIRSYDVTSDRFYITKAFADGSGKSPEYEEYTWDSNYIYLVRDTSWQPENWCNGQQTSFELWTGGRNRGVRFPRYVTHGQVAPVPSYIIKARKEGNGCGLCDSPFDSNGLYTNATYRFEKLASKFFSQTGKTVNDVIKVSILEGVGSDQNEVFYFAKALGWVGFESDDAWSHFQEQSSTNYEVLAKDACPGTSGCVWFDSRSPVVYHLVGGVDGLDWSANVALHPAGYLAYGPYTQLFAVGSHRADFQLMIDNRTANNDIVVTLDVVTAAGQRLLARREVRRQEFTSIYTWQTFSLFFNYPSFEELEVRIYWHDRAYIRHNGTNICK